MKRVLLVIVIFSTLAGSVEASLAHLPCNIAHSIAAYARVLSSDIAKNGIPNDMDRAVSALADVAVAYDALGTHLAAAALSDDETNLLFLSAQGSLEQFLRVSRSIPLANQRVIAAMLAQNERLLTVLP